MLSYTHLHPPLIANRPYARQVRAIQRDGIEVGNVVIVGGDYPLAIRQIGGVVEAVTREDAPNILNADQLDDGGSALRQGQPIVSVVPLGFALPSPPPVHLQPANA